MIGITVYVFRLLILLIVGKETAGELYTAFAIGGMVGSVYASALGPTLVLHEVRTGERYWPMKLKMSLWAWFSAGTILFLVSQFGYEALGWTSKTDLFLGAMGLSMIGGVVMVFAQRIRLRLLQVVEDDDVYGPDVMMNILILAIIPCLYYVVGEGALMTLYLINSIFAFLFYYSAKLHSPVSDSRFGLSVDTWKKIIVFLLIFPLFFQFTGNIFHDSALIFDSRGSLKYVPLPLSILACYLAIPLLGRYKRAYLSLSVIFLSFVLMLGTTVVSTHGRITEGQGKIILLLQFIVPMGGLVLGQIYEEGSGDVLTFEKISLYLLSTLIPLQLLSTWMQGQLLLSPYLYIFSIYQHLQYVPVIFVGVFLITLYSLGGLPKYKRKLFVLVPLMGIYAAASTSILAMVGLIGGIVGFVLYRWKHVYRRSLIACLVLVFVAVGGYMSFAINTRGMFAQKYGGSRKLGFVKADLEEMVKVMPSIEARLDYWKYYSRGIVNDYVVFLFGHPKRPGRYKYPSAHNYYLDFVYNFGILAILPLLAIMGYTVLLVYWHRQSVLSSSGLLGLTLVVLFLLFVDNGLKVGLRQPYPGILSFFLWGLLISKLSQVDPPMHSGKGWVSRRWLVGRQFIPKDHL
jgi:hypothetical protein